VTAIIGAREGSDQVRFAAGFFAFGLAAGFLAFGGLRFGAFDLALAGARFAGVRLAGGLARFTAVRLVEGVAARAAREAARRRPAGVVAREEPIRLRFA
jgi:hypothetical protein